MRREHQLTRRYCPTVKHVMLLLSLLTEGKEDGPHNLRTRPGMIILWNIAGLLMETREADENVLIEAGGRAERPRRIDQGMRFKKE